jgi:hypothetical protein
MPVLLALAALAPARADEDTRPQHRITQSDSYTMLEPMYATIVENGSPRGLAMVAIGLDIPNAELRGEAARIMPVLRDAYVRNLVSFSAAAIRPWQQPDVTIIARRLQGVTDRVLQKKGARVLLAQVAIRMTR